MRSPQEERASSYYSLTGEQAPYNLAADHFDAGRQLTDKNPQEGRSRSKKSRRRYVFEDSTDEDSEQGGSPRRGEKHWVGARAADLDFEVPERAEGPPTGTHKAQAHRYDGDHQKANQAPYAPPSLSCSTSRAAQNRHVGNGCEPEQAQRSARNEQRETKFTSMIRSVSEKQARNPYTDKLQQNAIHDYGHKPMDQYIMSSQNKSYARERPPVSSRVQDSEPRLVAMRGDVQHEHHHHHYHHDLQPQMSDEMEYGSHSTRDGLPQAERTATGTTTITSVARNHHGGLQFERRGDVKRSQSTKSTKSSKTSSSVVAAARMMAMGYGWNR